MNRRFFLGSAATVGLGSVSFGVFSLTGLFSQADETFASGQPPSQGCGTQNFPQPTMLSHFVSSVRVTLHLRGLLRVSSDITDFYNDVIDKYILEFGESSVLDGDGAYNEEINEAALILGDKPCHTPVPPETGCDYFEAWKFFRHHETLKVYPADASVFFRDLTPAQQLYVCEGTLAYAGMLVNTFGSLMAKLYPNGQLTEAIGNLQQKTEELRAALTTPTACQNPDRAPTPPALIRVIPG